LLNTLVAWANEGVPEEEQLCPELPAYLRFGVDKPAALELAIGGVRSRRLTHVVAELAASATTEPLRNWLAETDVRIWGREFDASPSELADLLSFTRVRDSEITSRVLSGETVEAPVLLQISPVAGPAQLREADEQSPPRIAVYQADQLVGYVRSSYQDDVARLLSIGVPLTTVVDDELAVRLRIDDPTERTAWFETDA
jgi:hypothetical protein